MEELTNRDWSWEKAIEEYKDELLSSGRHADSAIKTRLSLLSRVAGFAKKRGVNRPNKSSKALLQEYFASRKVGNNTKIVQIRLLCHFYDYLEAQYVVIDNCARTLPVPRNNKKERIIPSEAEIRNMYRDVLNQKNDALMLRDLVILDLLINPALRISELVGLRIQDVFFAKSEILVTRKGGDQQLLPIKKETLENIEEMLQYRGQYAPDDSLFITAKRYNGKVRPLGLRGAQKIVEQYMRKSFDLNKLTYGPHLLRHFGGTAMCRNGVDLPTVQSLMNHKNIQTTMIYQHTNDDQRRAAVDKGKNFYADEQRQDKEG